MNIQYLNPLRWKKSFLILLLSSFMIAWFVLFDTYSLLTRYQIEHKKSDLIEKTEELNQKTAQLESKIMDLENNPGLLEKIAREEYGMRKPNETVYKVLPE